MSEQVSTIESEAIVSEWRIRFRCPVDGRYVTVSPADFSAVMVHNRTRNGISKLELFINVKCLCGGMHTLEVE